MATQFAPDAPVTYRTAPIAWHRSHSISAPASCTCAVIASMSASAPLR